MLKKFSTVARYLLGLIFFLSGVVGLFNLVPPPNDIPEGLMQFMNGLMVSKYFIPFLKGTEMVAGFLILINIAPALMLIILAPISIHIMLVHIFLTPGLENLILPVVIILLHSFSAYNYWDLFRPLLTRPKPA